MRSILVGLAAAVFAASLYVYSTFSSHAADDPPADLGPVGATLLEGLGNHGMPITSDHPDVQRWFDQGVMLTYGFNHDAAERSFLKAAELDPSCAMCWWGAALVLGPNINAAMDRAASAAAWERVRLAQGLAANVTARERAYIDALCAGRIGWRKPARWKRDSPGPGPTPTLN